MPSQGGIPLKIVKTNTKTEVQADQRHKTGSLLPKKIQVVFGQPLSEHFCNIHTIQRFNAWKDAIDLRRSG